MSHRASTVSLLTACTLDWQLADETLLYLPHGCEARLQSALSSPVRRRPDQVQRLPRCSRYLRGQKPEGNGGQCDLHKVTNGSRLSFRYFSEGFSTASTTGTFTTARLGTSFTPSCSDAASRNGVPAGTIVSGEADL